MNYKIITDSVKIDRIKWLTFVHSHPNGNIFQSPEMFDVYKDTPKNEPIVVSVFDENESLVGLLVAVIESLYNGFLGFFSTRALIFGAPLIKDERFELLKLCISTYNKLIKDKAIYTEIRNLWQLSEKERKIFLENGYRFSDHLNIIQNLTIGENALWVGFSKSRKKGINKALNNDCQFCVLNIDDSISVFYQYLNKTYKRIKLPFPDEEHFKSIVKNIGYNGCKIFAIKRNNEIITILFVLIFKKTIYGYCMGSTDNLEMMKLKANDLLFWEVFKWAIDNKLNYFDWLGAGNPKRDYGVRDFKLQYGGKLQNFGRYNKIHKPILMKISLIGLFFWKKLKK